MSAPASAAPAARLSPLAADGEPVVVGDDLVQRFRLASRDENPLHVDAGYARTTSFGEPVVYGVLGGLVALAGVAPRPGQVATRVTLRFPGAVLVGRPLRRLVVVDEPDRVEVHLVYGAARTVEAAVEFAPGPVDRTVPSGGPVSVRATARAADLNDLAEGDRVGEGWQPRWDELTDLADRLGLAARGLRPSTVAALA